MINVASKLWQRLLGRNLMILLIVAPLFSCSATRPEGSVSAEYLQCVPYARQVSGIELYGDAHTWWYQAEKRRMHRGKQPTQGAVFVLAKSGKLKHGHVAVVRHVISPRMIEVAHANWGRNGIGQGYVYEAMRVKDISQHNDWSKVRFWNPDINDFGLPYSAKGFIYKGKPTQAGA